MTHYYQVDTRKARKPKALLMRTICSQCGKWRTCTNKTGSFICVNTDDCN